MSASVISVGVFYLLLIDLNMHPYHNIDMENTLAYAAGYLDGDGCFSINKKINPIKYHSRITVSSTDITILEFFKENFGGSCFLSNENIRYKNFKPIYQWVVVGKKAINLTEKLLPYLIEKKIDANFLLNFEKCKTNLCKDALIKELKKHRNQANFVNTKILEELKVICLIKQPCEIDYSYLAGFIDAECSFGISKYKPKDRPNHTYKISLSCNNTKADVFRYFMKNFGGHVNFIPKKTLNPKHKDQICWRISARTLSILLPSIYPFLKHKRPICKKLMEFYQTTLNNGGARHTDSFRESYARILVIREELVEEIHKLNFRGVKHI